MHNKPAELDLEDRHRYHTGSSGTKFIHAITSKLSLSFGKPDSPCDGRRVRDGDEGQQALANRDRTGNDEQPHPARQAMDTVHVAVKRRLQNAEEHSSSDITDVEESETDGQLGWFVPVEDQSNDAWPETG